jgi:ribosome maturation factor RimP
VEFLERDIVPFFIALKQKMIQKDHIIQLAETFLDGTENYLIDVKVSAANKIMVLIENDLHVSIKDCIALSRHIEHSLDREAGDFELEVSSPGIDQPFRKLRQYKKYLGKDVEVKLANGIVTKGKLVSATEQEIEVMPIPEKKKKNAVKTDINSLGPVHYLLSDLKETRLIITL